MSIATEILMKQERDQALGLCHKIKSHWEIGVGFRPSQMFPRGEAVSSDGQGIDFSSIQDWDHQNAPHLLEKIRSIQAKFPDIAANYSEALSAATRTLERLASSQC